MPAIDDRVARRGRYELLHTRECHVWASIHTGATVAPDIHDPDRTGRRPVVPRPLPDARQRRADRAVPGRVSVRSGPGCLLSRSRRPPICSGAVDTLRRTPETQRNSTFGLVSRRIRHARRRGLTTQHWPAARRAGPPADRSPRSRIESRPALVPAPPGTTPVRQPQGRPATRLPRHRSAAPRRATPWPPPSSAKVRSYRPGIDSVTATPRPPCASTATPSRPPTPRPPPPSRTCWRAVGGDSRSAATHRPPRPSRPQVRR